MTKNEYKKQKAKITLLAKDAKRKLDREFAFANNPVKLGDIVTDHYHTIKVNKIHVALNGIIDSSELPCCVYTGLIVNKNGKINKQNKTSYVYQANIVKKGDK